MLSLRSWVYLGLLGLYLGSVGGALYLGIDYGRAQRDQGALAELDRALERTFDLEAQLDDLRRERGKKTDAQVKIIRSTVDRCAGAAPADPISRVLDESDAARP